MINKILKIVMLNKYFILLISLAALVSCAKPNRKLATNKNQHKELDVSDSLDLPPHYFLPKSVYNASDYENVD
jgi:hypothetical protein